MMATNPLTALETSGFERFSDAASARKNEMMAEMMVHSTVTAMVTSVLSATFAQLKCAAPNGGSSAGWNIMAQKSDQV